jgi:transposase
MNNGSVQELSALCSVSGLCYTLKNVRVCTQSQAGLVVAQMEQRKYRTDLTDKQWAQVQAILPVARAGRTGRPRRWPACAPSGTPSSTKPATDAPGATCPTTCPRATWGGPAFGAGALTARLSRCTRPYARWCASKWAKRLSPRPALSTAKPYARRVKRGLPGL